MHRDVWLRIDVLSRQLTPFLLTLFLVVLEIGKWVQQGAPVQIGKLS